MLISRWIAQGIVVGAVASAASLAACGGGTPQTAKGPEAPPSPTGSAPPATTTMPPPLRTGEMKPIAASTMGDDLTKIGLDPKNLPALSAIAPDKLRQVMKTFNKALGVQCTACHAANDFRASTPNKRVAARMWSDYVRGLAMDDGSLLYCDSCHGGSSEFLDTHDEKALGAWMKANYVSKLKRVDAKPHGCPTCHGTPFDGEFLRTWAKK